MTNWIYTGYIQFCSLRNCFLITRKVRYVNKRSKTDKIVYYFSKEKWVLLIVTITGIIYNAGMVAGPWFEGQMVQSPVQCDSFCNFVCFAPCPAHEKKTYASLHMPFRSSLGLSFWPCRLILSLGMRFFSHVI